VKACVNCAKMIPDTALRCVFCGKQQDGPPPDPGAVADDSEPEDAKPAAANPAQKGTNGVPKRSAPGYDSSGRRRAPPAVAAAPPATRSAPNRAPPRRDADGAASGGAAKDGQQRPGEARAVAPAAAARLEPISAAAPQSDGPGRVTADRAADMTAPAYEQRTAAEAAAPLSPPERPPYLASETVTRMSAPVEPWANSLRSLCRTFGGMLILAFVLPWLFVDARLMFSWNIMALPGALAKTLPVAILCTGSAALVLAVLELSASRRGHGAAVLGTAAVLFVALAGLDAPHAAARLVTAGPFQWRQLLQLISLLALASGLLIRAKYPGAQLGRLMVSASAGLLVATYLLPSRDQMPVSELLSRFAGQSGVAKIATLYGLVPLVVAAASMMVWIPFPLSAGAGLLAWCTVAYWPLTVPVGLLAAPVGAAPDPQLSLYIWYHLPVALLAWFALGAFGLATVLGKHLEHN
jgi:hypothetical protein